MQKIQHKYTKLYVLGKLLWHAPVNVLLKSVQLTVIRKSEKKYAIAVLYHVHDL